MATTYVDFKIKALDAEGKTVSTKTFPKIADKTVSADLGAATAELINADSFEGENITHEPVVIE